MPRMTLEIRTDSKGAISDVKAFGKSIGGLNDKTKKGAEGFTGLWKQVAGGQAAFAVVQEGFRLLKQEIGSTVKLAMDAAETESMFAKVFKEETAAATGFVNKFSKEVGRSKFAVMGWAASFQDTFVPLGFVRKEARGLSQTLVELGVDLSSFKNIPVADVMNAMQSAIVGNHETMRQFGVIITQTTLHQELLNMGVQDGIKSATEQEKVQARLNLIIKGTADAQGDAIETAGSLANQTRSLKSTYEELKIEVGKNIIEQSGLNDIVGSVKETLMDPNFREVVVGTFTALIRGTKNLINVFGSIIKVGGNVLGVLRKFNPHLNLIIKGWEKLALVLTNQVAVAHDKAMGAISRNADINKKVTDKFRDLRKEMGLSTDQLRDLTEKYKQFEDPGIRYNKIIQDMRKGLIELTPEQKKVLENYEKEQTEARKLVEEEKKLSDTLNNVVTPAFINNTGVVKNNKEKIKELKPPIVDLRDVMKDVTKSIHEQSLEMVEGIDKTEEFKREITGLSTEVMGLFGAIGTLLSNLGLGGLGSAFNNVVGGIDNAVKAFNSLKDITNGFNDIANLLSAQGLTALIGGLGGVVAAVRAALPVLGAVGGAIGKAAGGIFRFLTGQKKGEGPRLTTPKDQFGNTEWAQEGTSGLAADIGEFTGEGGGFGKGGMNLARGGSFIVPQGFSGDRFPLMPGVNVESGEKITVTPKEQVRGGIGGQKSNVNITIVNKSDMVTPHELMEMIMQGFRDGLLGVPGKLGIEVET